MIKINNKYKSFFMLLIFALCIDYSFTSLAYPIYSLATCSILFCISIYSYRTFNVFIVLLGLLASVYLPLRLMYGDPNLGMVLSTLYTDHSEATEFIASIPKLFFIEAIGLFIFSLAVSRVRFNFKPSKAITTIFILLLLSVFTGTVNALNKNKRLIFLPILEFSNQFYKSYYDATHERLRLAELLSKPDDWNPKQKTARYDTFIMVIGESVRKDFMHSYGFESQNTPFTDHANGILYTNYYSAGPDTVISLTHSLTLNDANNKAELNNSIVTLMNKAGYKSYWISNQGTMGVFDTPISAIGKRANYSYFTKNGDYNDGNASDLSMMPEIESALSDKTSTKKFIVVHIMGSHPRFCDRTNGAYDGIYISKNVSCYVKSIEQTDLLLESLTVLSEKSKSKWTMMYFSDHGLKFVNKNGTSATLAHADDAIQDYHVPLFITSYDSKEHIINTNQYTARNFMSMFVDWTGVIDPRIKQMCNPLSESSCFEKNITAFNDNERLVNVLTLKDDSVSD